MRFLIQRVARAEVLIDNSTTGKIDKGFLVFIGIEDTDTEQIADKLITKLLGLRIFDDENGKTNLSLQDVAGDILLVSQFTLYANCKKGNRPSFTRAGAPDMSEKLYNYIVTKCKSLFTGNVETGEFGGDMTVSLVNDGPFTIWLDSEEIIG